MQKFFIIVFIILGSFHSICSMENNNKIIKSSKVNTIFNQDNKYPKLLLLNGLIPHKPKKQKPKPDYMFCPFYGTLCEFRMLRGGEIGSHLACHTRPIKCSKCSKRFSKSTFAEYHINKYHPNENASFLKNIQLANIHLSLRHHMTDPLKKPFNFNRKEDIDKFIELVGDDFYQEIQQEIKEKVEKLDKKKENEASSLQRKNNESDSFLSKNLLDDENENINKIVKSTKTNIIFNQDNKHLKLLLPNRSILQISKNLISKPKNQEPDYLRCPFYGTLCEFRMLRGGEIGSHLACHTQHIKCSKCSTRFSGTTEAKYHINKYHPNENVSFFNDIQLKNIYTALRHYMTNLLKEPFDFNRKEDIDKFIELVGDDFYQEIKQKIQEKNLKGTPYLQKENNESDSFLNNDLIDNELDLLLNKNLDDNNTSNSIETNNLTDEEINSILSKNLLNDENENINSSLYDLL